MTTPQQNKEVMHTLIIQPTIKIPVGILKDVISEALRGSALAYWASEYDIHVNDETDDILDFTSPGWALSIVDGEQNYLDKSFSPINPYVIKRDDITKGLISLGGKFPEVISRILNESYDANDADLLIQFSIFSDNIYG